MRATMLTVFVLILAQFVFIQAHITCKDNENNPVDWFIIYKFPYIKDDSDPLVRQGLGHVYMDVNSQEWSRSKVSLNSTGHALYYTLTQIYKNVKSQDVAYLMYNDETPEHKVLDKYGHTKGDIAFDKDTGFWLVHSLPRFPPYANEAYSWPESGLNYGQTFLCVTYNYKVFNDIGQQFLYNHPYVYDGNLPESFKDDNQYLEQVINGEHVVSEPWSRQLTMTSVAGQQFISFAKYFKFEADLYDAWLAPHFKSNLAAETWQNQRGKTPSNCTAKYRVMNIKLLKVSNTMIKETKDHSKWAVTQDENKSWICIGDINRDEEQKKRCGGTVCALLPRVWSIFNSSIVDLQPCNSSPKMAHDDGIPKINLI